MNNQILSIDTNSLVEIVGFTIPMGLLIWTFVMVVFLTSELKIFNYYILPQIIGYMIAELFIYIITLVITMYNITEDYTQFTASIILLLGLYIIVETVYVINLTHKIIKYNKKNKICSIPKKRTQLRQEINTLKNFFGSKLYIYNKRFCLILTIIIISIILVDCIYNHHCIMFNQSIMIFAILVVYLNYGSYKLSQKFYK